MVQFITSLIWDDYDQKNIEYSLILIETLEIEYYFEFRHIK